ncbi:hypothetical protein WA026_004374 [Henosepilachna vigintioctopunctata]|uniref:Uncharacterized protein n=1 Tax=Henosepilachna vigintioctopunctata TaxID=420089 RepID=A0AAW1V7V9_9CUCU
MEIELSNDTWFSGLDLMCFESPNFEKCTSDLRLSFKDERMVLLMHFPHYCEVAKRDLFLRTMVIWDAERYLSRSDTTENMKLFCERIKDLFTHYDQSRSIMSLMRQLRGLTNDDLCTDVLKNNYHRKIMMQNPEMKVFLVNALDTKIKENSLGAGLWEYLLYCVRHNLWDI